MVISRHLHTVHMGSEIPLGNTAKTLVVNLIRDLTDTAVLPQSKHRDLSVVVTPDEDAYYP